MLYSYVLSLQSPILTTHHSQPSSPPHQPISPAQRNIAYSFFYTFNAAAHLINMADTELDMSDLTSLESPQSSQPTDSPIPLFSSPSTMDTADNFSIYEAKVKMRLGFGTMDLRLI